LAGLRPDLLQALARLRLLEWLPQERIFPQGHGEDSATVAAIRAVYNQVNSSPVDADAHSRPLNDSGNKRLYYLP
jgi:hypothetical protein